MCVCVKEVIVAKPLRNLCVSIWDGGEVKGERQTLSAEHTDSELVQRENGG